MNMFKSSIKPFRDGSGNKPIIVMQPTWNEDSQEYRCSCCGCCKCCHIRIACLVVSTLLMVYAIINFINACILLGQVTDAETICYIVALFMVYPVLVVIAGVLVFLGVFLVRPVLVLPMVLVLFIGIIVSALAAIMSILAVTNVAMAALPMIKQNISLQVEIFGESASTELAKKASTWSYVVGFGIVAGVVIWFMYLFVQLYKYLQRKIMFMCLSEDFMDGGAGSMSKKQEQEKAAALEEKVSPA